MLFHDGYNFTVCVASLIIVEKCSDTARGKCGIRYVMTQGIQDVQYYSSEETRDMIYERCIRQWERQHQEGDTFQRFMQEHTMKGARLAEERAEKEGRSWE